MKRDAFRPTKLRPCKSVARAWRRNDLMRPVGANFALIRSGIHVMPACALAFICEGSQDGVVRDGEGVAGLVEEEEEEEEEEVVEDEGTFERGEMGEEVEGRGGRASVGRATAIGRRGALATTMHLVPSFGHKAGGPYNILSYYRNVGVYYTRDLQVPKPNIPLDPKRLEIRNWQRVYSLRT
ncbi:hypothetical protein G5I_07549 [Acromyrmex echinatior]|uniref:Uncharacterized protein n=1 Tax=Acromyrmex echinatior TaxID=103372 RepID=F4WP39_ACREC|nr:hypothetical protein G5I_07549 [Acromyrmex echinatior]